ncbi:MAG: hypothetical protein H7641_00615 [Candidatus Heimdallarchaeota archaeon]|nr:hypothetical protein [Candidatus Heimdallarchaeota archaeon]MCK4876068.1 hypothetical protein [Candidatus Heimdallarchaeota archaeon]
MTYEISIKKSALKFLKTLSNSQKAVIYDFLLDIKKQAVPSKKFDVVKLKDISNTFRARFGKIRVVYSVSWRERKILIHFIGWRKDAYK